MAITVSVPRSPSLGKKLFFSMVATLLFFLIAESVLRLIGFQFNPPATGLVGHQINLDQEGMQQDPDLTWSWIAIPNAQRTISIPRLHYSFEIHFNSAGYRGPVVSTQKSPGIFRIVTMGDSCAMGWGVGDDKTYSYRLQQLLTKNRNRRVEVMNNGVLGYTSFQGMREFENRTVHYNPDIVILCYNWNDHLPALGIQDGQSGNAIPTPDKFLPRFSLPSRLVAILSRSRFTELLEFLLDKTGVFSAINQHHETGKIQNHGIVVRVALPDFRTNLTQIVHEARARAIIPILMTEPSAPVVNIPLKQGVLKRYYFLQDAYNQAIREIAAKEGVVLIDPVPAFNENRDSDLFLDLVHPTNKGHALIAQQIAPVLQSMLPAN